MREIFIIQNVNNYERNLYVFDTKIKKKAKESRIEELGSICNTCMYIEI